MSVATGGRADPAWAPRPRRVVGVPRRTCRSPRRPRRGAEPAGRRRLDPGADGIHGAGKRLSSDLFVRASRGDQLDLATERPRAAEGCGIELVVRELDLSGGALLDQLPVAERLRHGGSSRGRWGSTRTATSRPTRAGTSPPPRIRATSTSAAGRTRGMDALLAEGRRGSECPPDAAVPRGPADPGPRRAGPAAVVRAHLRRALGPRRRPRADHRPGRRQHAWDVDRGSSSVRRDRSRARPPSAPARVGAAPPVPALRGRVPAAAEETDGGCTTARGVA